MSHIQHLLLLERHQRAKHGTGRGHVRQETLAGGHRSSRDSSNRHFLNMTPDPRITSKQRGEKNGKEHSFQSNSF